MRLSPNFLLRLFDDFDVAFSIGWSDMVVFLNYGDQFNKMRKLSSQPFTRQGSLLFQDIQLEQAHILLHCLLESPFEYWDPIQRYVPDRDDRAGSIN